MRDAWTYIEGALFLANARVHKVTHRYECTRCRQTASDVHVCSWRNIWTCTEANQGGLVAVGTLLLVLVTGVYAIKTGMALRVARRSADAAESAARSSEKQTMLEHMPFIVPVELPLHSRMDQYGLRG